ncbi:LysR family transcriptional regulator [Streptomyces zagrosensis]|uniref:DNA-binding transcriptional LysR family regulator n=1 Tax=Streptomyces zagrosensis TaxID=1042984 RepID=A0A7W9QFP0_9ACTN|nr:LysR family transcriptional regulator [Streptomyces zagrosensis]MBB5939139.1 DNA-binding transcriptional LysR family regulator [Streptomyces zagrosensis]
MFSLDRLRALHLVATHGTVAAAAAILHVTPSGISQQLAKLERETGHRLLEADGRGVRLTPAGEVLAGHAARIVDDVAIARADLDALGSAVAGPLRMGSFSTAIMTFLPPVLVSLQEQHPRLRTTVLAGEAEEMLSGVRRGELDLAVVESWEGFPTVLPPGLTAVELLSDVADVALPIGHPMAGLSTVELGRLADTPWATWTGDGVCHQFLVQTLRQRGFEPQIRCYVAGYPAQLALVAAGLVAALIPRLGRGPLPEGVCAIPTSPVLRRTVLAVHRSGEAVRPVVVAGVSALKEAVATL